MHIVHVLYSFGTGGLEKGIATVVRHGSGRFCHTIVCLTVSGASERLLPSGTTVVELRKPPGNSIRIILKLRQVLMNLRPDVVHTRNWPGMDGIIAARLAGIRNVVHGEHGWGMDDPDGRSPKRMRIRRLLSRWVREYTCVSRAIERWLEEEVRVRRPVNQIYNGVDTEVYRPGPGHGIRSELGIPPDAFVAGIVGRLDPIKDHPTLFRAFSLLREKVPSARLLVVGDGPERARLESLGGEGALFLGDRTDVPEILRTLDVFVLSSRNEGISNTVLEAMAAGLPVVATRVGGNPELVAEGETGTLVPPGDTEALCQALAGYALHPDRARSHGRAGRNLVEARFSIPAMVAGYEGVWERVAGGGRGQWGF
ncbi:MAG: glycosyltransferase [Deltaproteobacteria bacterium]|nr:glycosyltransferase [Deltaproteobacteria bacterium]